MSNNLPADLFACLDSTFSFPLSLPTVDLYSPFDTSSLLISPPESLLPESSPSSDNDSLSGPTSPSSLTLTPETVTAYPLPFPDCSTNSIAPSALLQDELQKPAKNKKRKSSKNTPAPTDVVQELLHEQEVKKKRLARKAELARMSRRRKKVRMGDLEQQVSELQAELARVREEAKILSAKNVELMLEKKGKLQAESEKTVEKAVDEFLLQTESVATQTSEAKLERPLSEVIIAHKKQVSSMECNVHSLEQSLVPCMGLQFLEWAMVQRDKFYEEDHGLFMSLFRDEMGATPKQLEMLRSLRLEIQKDQSKAKGQALLEAFRVFKALFLNRDLLRQQDILDKLRSIFTPKQLAAYFRWVNQYGHVLVKVPV